MTNNIHGTYCIINLACHLCSHLFLLLYYTVKPLKFKVITEFGKFMDNKFTLKIGKTWDTQPKYRANFFFAGVFLAHNFLLSLSFSWFAQKVTHTLTQSVLQSSQSSATSRKSHNTNIMI